MRTHKASGTVVVNAQNGQGTRMATIHNFCLYPSELITVSNHQYTKHYYQGSKRLASRVGGGFLSANVLGYHPQTDHVALPGTNYQQKTQNLLNLWTRQASGVDMDNNLEWAYEFSVLDQFSNYSAPGEIYFYHPDHLGSSAFITTTNGYATQFMAYQPYGETLLEQENGASYLSPYTFSAKEKDTETGYSYFGARYYSAELSVWLGVDPMADEAPGWTPYRYGFQNPVKFIDPDGMFEDEAAARAYAKENGIKTGLFRKNKIVKNEDGTYSNDNKRENTSTFQDKSLANAAHKNGVYTAPLISASKTNSSLASGPGGLLLTSTLSTLTADLSFPDWSDLRIQKWAGYTGAIIVGGIMWATLDQYLLHSKSRNENIWPDNYRKPNPKDVDWSLGDQALADGITGSDVPKGPNTPNNKIKKWFRDKRPSK
jgi:RHS repeat-associated protein